MIEEVQKACVNFTNMRNFCMFDLYSMHAAVPSNQPAIINSLRWQHVYQDKENNLQTDELLSVLLVAKIITYYQLVKCGTFCDKVRTASVFFLQNYCREYNNLIKRSLQSIISNLEGNNWNI